MNKPETNTVGSLGKFTELKKYIMEHPIKTVAITVSILFLLGFLFLGILRITDSLFQNVDSSFFDFVRFEGGVESWFAFYGSYFGMIATVVLGIITIRLDIKFKHSELITEINRLSLQEIRLYDMERAYNPSILGKEGNLKRFVLMLIFNRFDPYYEIDFKEAKWTTEGWENPLKIDIDEESVHIINADQMIIYLNFDDVAKDIEKTFNYYYRIRCYDSTMMELKQRQRQLILDILLQKNLYSNVEEIPVNIVITLENEGYQEGYMLLKEKKYILKIGSPFQNASKKTKKAEIDYGQGN